MPDHENPATRAVPDDFPDLPFEGALNGAHTKFSVVQDAEGRYRLPGCLPQDRQRNFEYCVELVAWGATFLPEKSQKAKYQHFEKSKLIEMFCNTLREDLQVPNVLLIWVVERVVDRLGWNVEVAKSPRDSN